MSRNRIIILALLLFNLVFWATAFKSSDDLEITFFDVGQGDSIFIETPSDFQVLIDGGPNSKVLEKLGETMTFKDRTIDLIVLTHPDKDHLAGLLDVLQSYEVSNILWTGVVGDTKGYFEWKRLIEEEGAEIIIASAGQRIDLAEDIHLFVHNPKNDISGQEIDPVNDTSVVLELVYNELSVLLTGDVSKRIEKDLDIEADILQIAHHGSKTSTSMGFLARADPELAIISVGENSYGHPNQGVLSNISQFAIELLTTKDHGDIKIISDGNNFVVK